jgi:hypothetical protein
MLEVSIQHQAAGLSCLAQTQATRLLAMVHHPGHSGEWRMLWSLCDALGGMGLSVVVLDGSATESAHNPGLKHAMLHTALVTSLLAESTPWTVLPAADGLAQIVRLGEQDHAASAVLGELFAHVDVVLLYGTTEMLLQLQPHAGVHPLLTVTSTADSLLANYQSLKQFALQTQMQPAVAAIESVASTASGASSTEHPLRRCAQAFLGRVPDWTSLRLPAHAGDEVGDDVVRLASRLLEIAPTLRHNRAVRKDH